jgi:EpsI family protein
MISWSRYVVVYVLLVAAAGYMSLHREVPAPLAAPLSSFPATVGPWRMVNQEYFNSALLAVLRPSDYLSRRYKDSSGRTVDLYIGYHDGGQGSGPIHSPKNCLPGSGWFEISSSPLDFVCQGQHVSLTQALYRQGARQELFLYCFMVRDRTFGDEIGLKVAEIANSIKNGQRGASFVRISLSAMDDPAQALATAESFFTQAFPAIRAAMAS